MAADVVEKETVREYNNKNIDKQKQNSKFEENKNKKTEKQEKISGNNRYKRKVN